MIDNFREWLSDNLRYILLGLAVLLVIIIGVCIFRLIGGSSSKKRASGKKTTAVTTSQKDEASTESAGSGLYSSSLLCKRFCASLRACAVSLVIFTDTVFLRPVRGS